MLNGMTAYLPTDTVIESGVLFRGPTVWGASMGGFKFDPGKTIVPLDYDGKRSDVQTLDRIVKWAPKITTTLIEFGGATSGNQIAQFEAGNSSLTHDKGTTTRYQPRVAGALFASGEYITDLRVVFERAGGGYAAIYFPIGFVAKYDLQGTPEKEAKIAAEFHARLSVANAVANPGLCPYSIELRTSTPS